MATRVVGLLTAGDDPDDFQVIPWGHLSVGEFGRSNGLTVVFDDHASGRQMLGEEDVLEGTGKGDGEGLAVGVDGDVGGWGHWVSMAGEEAGLLLQAVGEGGRSLPLRAKADLAVRGGC